MVVVDGVKDVDGVGVEGWGGVLHLSNIPFSHMQLPGVIVSDLLSIVSVHFETMGPKFETGTDQSSW